MSLRPCMPSTAPDPGAPVPAAPGPALAAVAPSRGFRLGRRMSLLLKFLVSACLVAYLASMAGKDELLASLRNASPALLLAAGLASLVEEVFRAWKQKAILARIGRALSMPALLWMNLRIFALSLLLPGELLGGGARVILMRRYLTLEQSIFLVLYDRYTQMAVTLLLGAVLAPALSGNAGLTATFATAAVALAAAPAIFLHPSLASRLGRILPAGWAAKAGEAFARMREHFAWNPANLGILLLSVAYQLVRAAFVWALCFAAGIDTTLPVVLLYLSLIILVQHLPISFGGLGVREVTTVGFFQMYGVGVEKALALSLLIYALTLAKAAFGGLAMLPGRAELRGGEAKG